MKKPWRKTPAPRADPLRIAVLEYELLGIEPKPGTAAAAAVGLRHFAGTGVAAVIDFPQGMPRREMEIYRAVWERTAANSFPFQKADGTIEIVCQDPSAAHLDHRDNRS
ncbi:hypothetical protein K1Y80_02490 [Streptomyces sp. MAG02]|nr:hypothetical protein [Streptomyces sp. MAG02]